MQRALKSQTFFIILSVLYVVTGIVILVWPNLSIPLLGKALGIGMLVVGCTHIILYFTRDHMTSVLHMDLTVGVVFAAFGAFLLMHSDFVEIALPFAVGILLLIGAMIKVQYGLDMRRIRTKHWYFMLFFAAILLAAGLCLLYNPFAGNILIYVIGAALIVEGLLNIFCILFVSHRMKQIARGKVPGPGKMDTPLQAPGYNDEFRNTPRQPQGPTVVVDEPVRYEEKPEPTIVQPAPPQTPPEVVVDMPDEAPVQDRPIGLLPHQDAGTIVNPPSDPFTKRK